VDVGVAGRPGHGNAVEVVRHVVGRRPVDEVPRFDVVLADCAGGADDPEPAAVVGRRRAVEVVAVPGRSPLQNGRPAGRLSLEEDTAVTGREGVLRRVADVV